jgi:prephenate dehydrogenase
MFPRTIAIIGLGLIGGSLGMASQKKLPRVRVLGLSRSSAKIRRAKQKKAIAEGSTDPREVLSRADLVILCTPVSKISYWIRECEKWARPGCLVTDVGSTKRKIVSWAERMNFKKIRFVGSHPMAGSHRTGLAAAEKTLFDGSLCFVTRTRKTDVPSLKTIVAFWKKIAAKVILLDPSRHDRIAAEISHLPHALAALLVLNASASALPFAATGFRDATRIAQGDPALWRDIFLTNRQFIRHRLQRQVILCQQFMKYLETSDSSRIHRLLTRAARIRRGFKSSLQKAN